MDLYEFIILMIGMAFWGTVPPVVVAWYIQKQGEKIAKERVELVIAHAEKILVARFESAKGDILESVRCSINGYMGNKVKDIKKTLNEKMNIDAGPLGAVLGDALGGIAEDYGYGKKKVVSQGIMALFRKKPSAQQMQQEADLIKSYMPPEGPKIIEEYNRQ